MGEMPVEKLLESLLLKDIKGNVAGNVTGLAYHSEKVETGNLFFALPGTRSHGWEYARDAVDNGALAVVVDEEAPELDVPCIKTPDVRLAMAVLANTYYNNPSTRLHLTGVTGTNGKTTTTYLIDALHRRKGFQSGLIGTVDYKIGDEVMPPLSTTPEASDLQKLFDYMLTRKVSHVVMEVSSHAMDWQRVSGNEFDVVVLTNITEDHLDFHHNFESYLEAKTKLFAQMGGSFTKRGYPRAAVLNKDDPNYAYISSRTPVQQISYAVNQKADIYADNMYVGLKGNHFTARTFAGDIDIELNLRGMFNVYNSLAAFAVGLAQGMGLQEIKEGLESVTGVPGRFEQIDFGQDYLVVIDYAHTVDSLENVLQTARNMLENGRLITVFGCGGDRDRSKRPLMGEVAGKYSEKCVVTSDNPRSEDPQAIVDDILPGLEKKVDKENYHVILDRYEAINKAINLAQKGDIIVIAGKGHEEYQVFADRTIDFSDRQVAEEIILSR